MTFIGLFFLLAHGCKSSEKEPTEELTKESGDLCERVYLNGIALGVPSAPDKAEWDKMCGTFPNELLQCAATATTAAAFQDCGEKAPLPDGVMASSELCSEVYAKGTSLKIDPFPSQEEWQKGCASLPIKALECAAKAEDVDAFHQCGQAGTPNEGDFPDKELCERAHAKGLELGVERKGTKEEWDIECPRVPRVFIACAAQAKTREAFLACGQ